MKYTTIGNVRGCCGHLHQTEAAAERCLRKDQNGCEKQGGYRPVAVLHDDQWIIFAGCRKFTIAESRDHWGKKYTGDRETGDQYLAAMDWLERKTKGLDQ